MTAGPHHTAERLLAAGLLLLLSPAMALVGVIALVAQGRPVLFHQKRAGLHGRTFVLHKFRTMHRHTQDGPHAARATDVGRILRRFGLDELPQLVNIVRGEMSFIGPRPALPEQAARYGPHERRRLEVRPGITGWAQIHGRNAISWDERISLDVWYIDHRTPMLDARIIWHTLKVLASGRGVYGARGTNPDFAARELNPNPAPGSPCPSS